MPVKARRAKRRTSDAADLAAWEVLFESGHDFFGKLGFRDDAEARKAARWAWRRLGAAFLASHAEDPLKGGTWALETFGEPPCR